MDILLVLTYTAICIVVFKVFKIPLTKWTVPTAVLGGIILIGAIMVGMNYSHPYSSISREYFYTTPISPTVRGRVIEVDVKPNVAVKMGDPLFKLDPEPFEDKVNELKARLHVAEKNLYRAKEMVRKGLGREVSLDQTQANVDSLKAQLEKAQFDLDQSVVRAPTDGYVNQLFLRPGMIAVPIPLKPVMVFVHQEPFGFVAWFRQNSLLRLEAGYEAEIAFDGLPGKVFKGEVETVLPLMAEGQLQPTGTLLTDVSHQSGLVPVIIKITDPAFEEYKHKLPGGAFAQTAVYSEHLEGFAIIRKVLLRMASWMNYLFPIH